MCVRTALLALLAVGLFAPTAMARSQTPAAGQDDRRPGINLRQRQQAARIRAGRERGAINRAELQRLRGLERWIRVEERRFRRSGDGLTRREVRKLQRDLNQAGRAIRRALRNGRAPGGRQAETGH
jgi:hypothetical protein